MAGPYEECEDLATTLFYLRRVLRLADRYSVVEHPTERSIMGKLSYVKLDAVLILMVI